MRNRSIPRRRRRPPQTHLLVTALVATVLVACTGGAPPQDAAAEADLPSIRAVNSVPAPSIGYFPFYIAEEQGWYRAEGVELEIVGADGSAAAMQQLVSGNADVAIATMDSALAAADRGEDLRFIYQHFYRNVFDIYVLSDSDVQDVADLRDTAVGVVDFASGEVPTVRASLQEAQLSDGTDVTLIPVGEGAPAFNALSTGRIAAIGGSPVDASVLESHGVELRKITPDFVAAFPGDGLVVQADLLEDPDKRAGLVAMIRATVRGYLHGVADTADATRILSQPAYTPEMFEDGDVGANWLALTQQLATPADWLEIERHGTVSLEATRPYVEFLVDQGILDAQVTVESFVDNSLVDAAWTSPLS